MNHDRRGTSWLRGGATVADVCERLELSLEQGERLDKMFSAWNGGRVAAALGAVAPPGEPREDRLILDPDPEMLRWEKEIDDEARRAATDGGEKDDDGGPPSSHAA